MRKFTNAIRLCWARISLLLHSDDDDDDSIYFREKGDVKNVDFPSSKSEMLQQFVTFVAWSE